MHDSDSRGGDGELPRQKRKGRIATVILLPVTVLLWFSAGYLSLMSLGLGLTTPGSVASRDSELAGYGVLLAGITGFAALIAAAGARDAGWPLPRSFSIGLLGVYLVVTGWLVVLPVLRL